MSGFGCLLISVLLSGFEGNFILGKRSPKWQFFRKQCLNIQSLRKTMYFDIFALKIVLASWL